MNYPMPYRGGTPINQGGVDGEGRFLPFLAGLAITAPFWAGGFGFGRRCCFGGGFGGYPYPVPYPYPLPYTFNTYQGVVGSPFSFYYGRPFPYY